MGIKGNVNLLLPQIVAIVLLPLSLRQSSVVCRAAILLEIVENCSSCRRILHEPLFPTDGSSPPAEISISPPDQPFFSAAPPPPPAAIFIPPPPPPVATVAANIAAAPPRSRPGSINATAIGVSISVTAVVLVCISVFLLYRRRLRCLPETEKLTGGGNAASGAAAASDFFYLGMVNPVNRKSAMESDRSPYRKLNSRRDLNSIHQPSPELHPLPPLGGQQMPPPPPPPPPSAAVESPTVTLSDDDGFNTPQRSAAMESTPRSSRTSPTCRLSNSTSSETTEFDPSPAAGPPPPPPPPPPPLPNRRPSPCAKPLHVQKPEIIPSHHGFLAEEDNPASLPVRPSSRRQWGKPLSADKLFPVAASEADNGGESGSGMKPRLKPLHWDKVRASSDRAMVWDQLKSSSFQLNEDRFETLFCNSATPVPKRENRGAVPPPLKQENRVLDPKKSQNIAILLRALNVTWEEVSDALLDGSPEGLGVDLLETLVKMAPSKEEELRLRNYEGDVSRLGPAERFLKQLLEIPFAFQRIDALLYKVNFPSEVKYLKKSFESLEAACEELKNCRLFLKLLDAVLKTGNRMNMGTNRGEAKAFKLDTLLKLIDVKGVDQKTTLLHFVVTELLRSEPGMDLHQQALKMAAGLNQELPNVKKSAAMDSEVLSSYLSNLESGLKKVKLGGSHGRFVDSMKVFLNEADKEVNGLKSEERRVLGLVRETTGYFHGDTMREEAHPFRIFMVVRDFLLVLDRVCREIGEMKMEPFDSQGGWR